MCFSNIQGGLISRKGINSLHGLIVIGKERITLIYEMRFRSDVSKKFFTQKGAETLAQDTQSLEVFKASLNGVLCSLILRGATLPTEQEDLKRSLPT